MHRILPDVTPEELREIAERLYGDGWRVALCRAMEINRSTMGRWLNGSQPIPASVALALRCLVRAGKKGRQ